MNTVIVDYKAGNVQSVLFALERLGVQARVTANAEEIQAADKVIFPGVGEASSAMRALKAQNLDQLLPSLTQPFLGICLGMQLLCQHSEEGDTEMLGIIPVPVRKFEAAVKIPHMGWNNLHNMKSGLFTDIKQDEYAYFVHSFYAPVTDCTIAECSYPTPFSAALQYKNFYAVQFHAEKSGPAGAKILQNFLNL